MPRWTMVLAVLALSGCSGLSDTQDGADGRQSAPQSPPPSASDAIDPGTAVPVEPMTRDPGGPLIDANGFEVVVPTDERPVAQAATPPPPISGGTLLVTGDGKFAVAADSDRDRVSIVDLVAQRLVATIALEPGDEPGRLVEDDGGQVHVALRRAGAVATIDLATATLVARRPVCGAPRGIAFDSNTQSLHVACAGGQLVTLAAGGVASLQLDRDLRDVLVYRGKLFASRFKRAELVALADDGTIGATAQPSSVRSTFTQSVSTALVFDELEPDLAWRTTVAKDGRVFMLHQGARTGTIQLGSQADDGETAPSLSGPYGGGATVGDGCSMSIVQTELSVFSSQGEQLNTVRVPGVVAVDAALNPLTNGLAVVYAGARDRDQPARELRSSTGEVVPSTGAGTAPSKPIDPIVGPFSMRVFDTTALSDAERSAGLNCLSPVQTVAAGDFEPVAIASAGDGWVMQSREPAQIITVSVNGALRFVDLGGDSVADTGHALFHHDAGGGIACASCHGEGGEDGHVWHFSGSGPRRTQALQIGLEGTAPFHWSGDMAGVSELMEEVLVTRMGGVHESGDRTAALERWLFSLRPAAPLRSADDPAVARGHELFMGAADCASCHSGDKLTNNENADVGTGEALQVPSLIGVGYRGPWLHSGCADSLRDRFDPTCGGDKHGKTADLDSAQIDDLVAYLESL